jgi:hypothetical protein
MPEDGIKFPVFVLPNVENKADVSILDAQAQRLTATEFSIRIGGIKTLRFMASEKSIEFGKPQITAQATTTGEKLFCFAYPFGRDVNQRITSGAIVFRESDVDAITFDSNLQKLAEEVGITSNVWTLAKPLIAEFNRQEALAQKKKP